MDKNFDPLQVAQEYKERLISKILPFWLKYGIDSVHGGIYTGLDRDGSILETDKSVWFQGRALWTFASAYSLLKDDPMAAAELNKYRLACAALVQFIEKYCTDPKDGRMYFRLSAAGKPIIKRIRYFFSETFVLIGFAAYALAFEKKAYAKKALDLFFRIEQIRNTPGILEPKFNPENAASRNFGIPMIMLNTVSELQKTVDFFNINDSLPHKDFFTAYTDSLLKEIQTYFVRPERHLVIEQCGIDSSLQENHFEGRLLNPGHAIEGAWFIMKEGLNRKDKDLQNLGLNMLDWMWDCGWDTEFGGIIYFRDLNNKSPTEYWHDMKFWWPQNEAVIANLYALLLSKNEKYKTQFLQAHNYFHQYFPDEDFGECYGYLHRDGRLSTPLKGNMYKGPFHIPRMYMEGIQVLQKI